MINVLKLNNSLNGADGNSNKLTQKFIDRWQQQTDQIYLVERDLAAQDLGHLSAEEMQAWMTPADERSERQRSLAAISDQLLTELEQADAIVVGMPMYNLGIPSVFKAWIDRVARAGRSFKYTENGPVGLLTGQKVYVLAARGGMYAGTPKDSQTQYLTDLFAFLGINDVQFVYVEGLAMGADAAANAWKQGDEKIIELIENQAA